MGLGVARAASGKNLLEHEEGISQAEKSAMREGKCPR